MAYVTRPHNWRISVACGKIKPPQGNENVLNHGLQKNKTSVRGENTVKLVPACKNLIVQVKIQAGVWHVLHTWWYVWIINICTCGEGDWCPYFVLL
jgi:hypothetical protein